MKTGVPQIGNKGPKLPDKPKFRSLASTAKAIRVVPYIIDGDPDKGLFHEENFVVALGPLKYRSYANYENMFSESLDNAVSKVLYVMSVVYRTVSDEKDTPKLETDELNRIKTPYGLMHGSLERNMVDLSAYILSQYGTIKEDRGDGLYEYEPVTMDDIIDNMDAGAITRIDEADGQSLFFEILEVSGVWKPSTVAEDLAANNEIDEEELKNSTCASTGSGSSRVKKKAVVEKQP